MAKIHLSFEFDSAEEFLDTVTGWLEVDNAEAKPKRTRQPKTKDGAPTAQTGMPAAVVDFAAKQMAETIKADFSLPGLGDQPQGLDSMLGVSAPVATLTIDNLRDKASPIAKKSPAHANAVIALIKSYGASALADLPLDKYQDFFTKLDSIK